MGYLTASGRGAASDPSWYVFNHARVYGSGGAGSTYLGRPWGTYARVVWQNSQLGDVVNAKGWSIWTSTSSTANVYFKEFNNTGAGAGTSQRVSFSGQLKSAVAITDILGEDYKSQWWDDTSFL
ncbi:unnamed protein product [Phytophthora lilii]|uniref:pectinesterase n=1 Tax=Phytophthora lilii TaxID=2077276 RepID=A0A9W6WWV6_9STRA|nr:unnamed protein product [Phytophthora lilii]